MARKIAGLAPGAGSPANAAKLQMRTCSGGWLITRGRVQNTRRRQSAPPMRALELALVSATLARSSSDTQFADTPKNIETSRRVFEPSSPIRQTASAATASVGTTESTRL